MAFTGPMEDRLLIRERYETYSDASMRKDMDAWLDNWTDNASWTLPWATLRGREELRDQCAIVWDALDRIGFFPELCAIEVEGDTAQGRSFVQEIILLPSGERTELIGLYEDRLVRQGNVWRFAERNYTVHMGTPPIG